MATTTVTEVEAVPDLHIIPATGVCTYADVPGFFAERGPGAVPDLLERGVDRDQVDQMLVTNPRAWFERT